MRRVLFVVLLALLVSAFLPGARDLSASAEKAPEIGKSSVWLNSSPLTLKALKGKVVVVEFWAFDCAPCLEAMPHVVQLHEKYASRGLVVIGVHAPRTQDERNLVNVRQAVERLGIRFPVVLDNTHKIWDTYRCDLWPTLFVIDAGGLIRYVRGGVGRYEEAEHMVQTLLTDRPNNGF
jgi:thiol-disulfide isomerase/thioredoxin